MKEFLFKFEKKNYITSADTLLDAEIKFWDEFGYDPESCVELENVDEFIISNKDIIYF